MNNIKRLQLENKALKASRTELINNINTFRGFLFSSKFHNDTTIQVKDVDREMVDLLDAMDAKYSEVLDAGELADAHGKTDKHGACTTCKGFGTVVGKTTFNQTACPACQ